MQKSINTKFNLQQEVFHIAPESPKGIITDITYSFYHERVLYLVTWGYQDEAWCKEIELTEDKTFM